MAIIAVGCDHAGYHLKERLASELRDLGHEVVDLGTDSTDRVDYPDFGAAVGRSVSCGEASVGVAVCGSGVGIAIAANKVAGIRAATVHDVDSARLSKAHNDANVLCFGERVIDPEVAAGALRAWLDEDFEGGRHEARVAKLDALDG
ncbi:MAG: ribose 5-phosphate isomerase B [Actinomycetota bacterium]|nr:ribose 5-phosphate isomerase B [Actinomycetota bacterium]